MNHTSNRFPIRSLVLAIAVAYASNSHADDGFTPLDTIPNLQASSVTGISADGSTVVGTLIYQGNLNHAYTWSNGVTTDLMQGQTTTGNFRATGVSSDGSVVVGQQFGGSGFRYEAGNFTVLNPAGTDVASVAFGVSGNGAVVVGGSCTSTDCGQTTNNPLQAVEWVGSNGTAIPLATVAGQTTSQAFGANGDGTVIVGSAHIQLFGERPIYWLGGNAYDLGTILSPLQTTAGDGRAVAVSANGQFVAGSSVWSSNTNQFHATLWNATNLSAPVAIDLGILIPNGGSEAFAISADGKVVVGTADDTNSIGAAFRWSQGTGMQTVAQWLANAGITVPTGWTLQEATGTNSDGSIVVGDGPLNGVISSWLARVSNTGNGIINVNNYNTSLVETASRAIQAGTIMPNLALFGAHHRSILDSGLARSNGSTCAWATADAAGNDRADTHAQLTEAGVCKDIDNARFGIGIGQAWSQQDWSQGGGAHYNGQYLILEGAQAFANGLEPSVTAYYGRFNTSLDRHYANGAGIDHSGGNPDALSYAVRARLDWKNAAQLGRYSLSPYAAYTWMKTELDAYTETGGGFPAQFAAGNWTTNDVRVGSAAETAISSSTDLHVSLEAVHRAEGSTDGVNGQVVGLWSFSLPGQSTRQNWARTTIDIDHRLTNSTLLTFGANLATPGGDATWGVTAGVRATF